jgi:hypothetical protein
MTTGSPTIVPSSPARPVAARTITALVWLTWAIALAGILGFIAHDGRNIPFEEDWLMVGPMTGHEPHLLSWFWSQNSEHRLPLPRLVNLTLLRATGDFRWTMVFDTLALAAVAAAMILAARALRGGRTSVADAFFPLLLLHLGHWDNLVWAWQIQFVLPTALVCVVLLAIVSRPMLPTHGATIAGALALIGLPLSGANGLVLTPPLAAWFAYTAWTARREALRGQRMSSWLPAGAAFLALLLCVAYFIGFQSSPWNAPSPGLRATLGTSAKFLALSVGPVAAKSWPLFGAVVSLILLTGLWTLAGARRWWEDERVRIVGLAAFFVAIAILTMAVGWGRSGRTAETGRMSVRYVLLAAPSLCAAYFTFLLFGKSWIRRAGPAGLVILLALLFPLNILVGLDRRDWFGAGMAAFERDLASGAPAEDLAQRHYPFMLHWDPSLMVVSLRRLHDAGVGPFAEWEPDPLKRSGATARTP